ncbi:MAG: hypothetical protein KME27_10895 [Lyngbya sp. HA4199-MV5]|nr:hypothetical protein [Lyngbya sp. HA4199-MV5]
MHRLLELPHAERKTLFVHESLVTRIKAAALPGEHQWQTVQRLLEAGLRQHSANDRVA